MDDMEILIKISSALQTACDESPIALHTLLGEEIEISAIGGLMRHRWETSYQNTISWDRYASIYGEAFFMGLQFSKEKK